jgi:predicted RNA binding protein YcfA (HicA-like mRNA interferase family)
LKYPKEIWDQLKNITCDEFTRALKNDGFKKDITQGYSSGARIVFLHPVDKRRIAIDYHPGKTYGPKLLKKLLADTDWTINDMRRLKLIK